MISVLFTFSLAVGSCGVALWTSTVAFRFSLRRFGYIAESGIASANIPKHPPCKSLYSVYDNGVTNEGSKNSDRLRDVRENGLG